MLEIADSFQQPQNCSRRTGIMVTARIGGGDFTNPIAYGGLGEKLRQARLERKMTQEDLSEGIFSKSYVSAVELGKIQPSLKALRVLSKRLELPLTEFLDKPDVDRTTQFISLSLARLHYLLVCSRKADLERSKLVIQQLEQAELDELQQAELTYLKGRGLKLSGNFSEALSTFQQAITRWEKVGHRNWVAQCRYVYGELLGSTGSWLQAQAQFQLILEAIAAREISDLRLKFNIFSYLIANATQLGIAERLNEFQELARVLSQNLIEPGGFTRELGRIAEAEAITGNHEKALALFEEAIWFERSNQLREGAARLLYTQGNAFAEQHNISRAAENYQLAAKNASIPSEGPTAALACNGLARLLLKQGKLEEALENAVQAEKLVRDTVYCEEVAGDLNLTLGEIYHKLGQPEKADQSFQHAFKYFQLLGSKENLAAAYFNYATICKERGNDQQSLAYMKAAFENRNTR
jgi:tetratricopeptide (TPR) repeat protein